jgi:hypothetical protein
MDINGGIHVGHLQIKKEYHFLLPEYLGMIWYMKNIM